MMLHVKHIGDSLTDNVTSQPKFQIQDEIVEIVFLLQKEDECSGMHHSNLQLATFVCIAAIDNFTLFY